MSLALTHAFDSLFVPYLLEPAVRALALAGVVWLVLRMFRVRDVGLRLAAWTVVLCAALAMPFLGRVMPAIPVLLPAMHASSAAAPTRPVVKAQAAVTIQPAVETSSAPLRPVVRFAQEESHGEDSIATPATEWAGGRDALRAAAPTAVPSGKRAVAISWPAVATVLYGLVAGLLLGRLAIGLALGRRIERQAEHIEDKRLERLLEREARRIGLGRLPRLLESAALSVPAAIGVLRPRVLLPQGWNDWSDEQIEAVLAHELSHVARRDPLTQLGSRVYRAIFWFSPLGWWLNRAVVDLAEQASDDAALRAGADRTRYAEVLLHFLRALGTARRRVRWQAVSMAQGSRSARRVERVLSGSTTSVRLGRVAVAAVALTLLPLACLAAGVEPSFFSDSQMPAPPSPKAPPPPPAAFVKSPIPLPAPAPAPAPAPQTPKVAPAPPRLPSPAPEAFSITVPAPLAPPVRLLWFSAIPPSGINVLPALQMENETWYENGNCEGSQAFVIVSGRRTIAECASASDIARVDALRAKVPGDFLWFRRNGRAYVVRDPATVNAAIAAFAPGRALARQQRELGREQAALGRKQAELGMRQSEVRIPVPDFSATMRQVEKSMRQIDSTVMRQSLEQAREQMKAAFQQLDSSATQRALARAQEQLNAAIRSIDSTATEQAMARVEAQMAAMQSKLGELQAVAGQKQAELGAQQAALGQRQAQLGRQQEQLGRKQEKTARKAAREVRRLIDRAMAKGLAKAH